MRAFVKEGDLKAGDKVTFDDAFTCLSQETQCTVYEEAGNLIVRCTHGKHFLDGQLEDGVYVGVYKESGE